LTEQHRRRIAAILLPMLVASVVAACGSAGSSAPPAPASTASPATQAPSASAEPDTAAGAKSAAETTFELYSGGQYSTVWQDMVPGFRAAVPEATYVAVHDKCPTSGLSYQVTRPVLTEDTAVVTVSLAGAASALASETEVFQYVSGTWLWAPSTQLRAPYKAGTVSAIVQKMKSEGICESG
jgi:hypothetical protein